MTAEATRLARPLSDRMQAAFEMHRSKYGF